MTLKANLDRMAQAGGEPNPDAAYDYYPADSQQALLTQLQRIITTITGGGDVGSTTLCDDTCYSLGCPNPGEVCAGATCKPNPAAASPAPKDSTATPMARRPARPASPLRAVLWGRQSLRAR